MIFGSPRGLHATIDFFFEFAFTFSPDVDYKMINAFKIFSN